MWTARPLSTIGRGPGLLNKRAEAMTKLIGIEEHFLTADIRAAWAASAIGQEGVIGFDRGEIKERPPDPGRGFR